MGSPQSIPGSRVKLGSLSCREEAPRVRQFVLRQKMQGRVTLLRQPSCIDYQFPLGRLVLLSGLVRLDRQFFLACLKVQKSVKLPSAVPQYRFGYLLRLESMPIDRENSDHTLSLDTRQLSRLMLNPINHFKLSQLERLPRAENARILACLQSQLAITDNTLLLDPHRKVKTPVRGKSRLFREPENQQHFISQLT